MESGGPGCSLIVPVRDHGLVSETGGDTAGVPEAQPSRVAASDGAHDDDRAGAPSSSSAQVSAAAPTVTSLSPAESAGEPGPAGTVPTGAPTADAQPAAAVGGARRRGDGRSMANMVRTLVPLVALILLVVWLSEPGGERVHVVDPTSDITAARQVAKYSVLVPEGLSSDWRPNHSDLAATPEGNATLEIGYVTPDDDYARLVESDLEPDAFLRDTLGAAESDGTIDVGGQTWDRQRAANGEVAIVHRRENVTIVVTGSAAPAELTTLARSLR